MRLALALICACSFSFGAIVKIAYATSYHTNCVGHGFVHGSSQTDGSFFSRVEDGCGSYSRHCAIYSRGDYAGEQNIADGSSICNAWSRSFGTYTECASTAHVADPGVFSEHVHLPDNWCG